MPLSQPRVLVLPASYLARNRTTGGGERYAFEISRALAELTPTTMALFGTESNAESTGKLKVRTYPVKREEFRWHVPVDWATWRELGRFDVYHLMVFPTMAADFLAIRALLSGGLIVLTDVGGGGRSWSVYLARLAANLSLMRRAHGLAHLSQHASTFFQDWRQPSTVLFGGANLSELAARSGQMEGYALFVGRILPHKGLLPLVQGIPVDVPLHVVGRPYDVAYLERVREAAKGKRVTFIHDADDRELTRQYAGANVVLQPSLPDVHSTQDRSELLGLVALEGMASGKPVIVTRCTSLPELVIDGETGFIVKPGDVAEIGGRVAALVRDPSLAARMGAAARRHVEARFTWDRVATRALELYSELGRLHGKSWARCRGS